MNKEQLKEAILKFDLSRAKTGRDAVLGHITDKQADNNLERELETLTSVIDQYAYEYAERVIGDNEELEGNAIGKRFIRDGLRDEQRKRNKELSSHRKEERKI